MAESKNNKITKGRDFNNVVITYACSPVKWIRGNQFTCNSKLL